MNGSWGFPDDAPRVSLRDLFFFAVEIFPSTWKQLIEQVRMSRARKKESCTCIYRCFTSKTPGCIPCLSLGSACPTPLKWLNWRLSFKFPSYTSELRGTLFQKTQHIDPAKARAQTSWSRVWVITTKATRSHNLPITITSTQRNSWTGNYWRSSDDYLTGKIPFTR